MTMLLEQRVRTLRWVSLILLVAAAVGCSRPAWLDGKRRATRQRCAAWGAEALAVIERDFRVPDTTDYYEDEKREHKMTGWPGGLTLMATATAAHVRPREYRQHLMDFITEMDRYWNPEGPVPGYDSELRPQRNERYYDDNCWIALGLADAYALTHDPEVMRRLVGAYRYIFSGEDKELGGGIYWKETGRQGKRSKNTCSNAPAAVVALKMYGLTGEQRYLEDGKRIMTWLKVNLQDPADHLFWDNKRITSGRISQTKFSYNTGMPIQAWVLLYRATHEEKYLKEAQATAGAAVTHWFDPILGTMRDGGAFAFTLTEGLMRLAEVDGNAKWRECAEKTAQFVHERGRDAKGRYPERWSTTANGKTYDKYMVRHTAPAAYLFWRLAEGK